MNRLRFLTLMAVMLAGCSKGQPSPGPLPVEQPAPPTPNVGAGPKERSSSRNVRSRGMLAFVVTPRLVLPQAMVLPSWLQAVAQTALPLLASL